MPTFARRRDRNEPAIVAALTAIGCSVTRLNDWGVCDLLVGYRSRTILIEVKDQATKPHTARSSKTKRAKGNDGPPENAKGQLTPTQVEWWKNWTGGEAYVVETPEEAVRLVRGAALPKHVKVFTKAPAGDFAHVVIDQGISEAYVTPDEADALAGALHEQAGVARGLTAGAAAQAKMRFEHIAVRALEVGDASLEALCDLAIAGDPDAAVELDDHAANNPDLAQWVESGRANGFRTRTASRG